MEDYWGGANNGDEAVPAADAPQVAAPAPSAPAVADDDVDMIE
jgi:hypothetical protein